MNSRRGAKSLWLSEQGCGSNGELTGMRWTEAQQAQLNAASEYLAWHDGQVAAFPSSYSPTR